MMKTLLAASAAVGLAMSAAPAVSQTGEMGMTTAQQTMYDGWPADRQTTYDAWPMEAKTYYWTLNANQQRGWWALNDEQRVRIVGMTPEQRAAAWTSIMNQMSGSAAATAATTTSTAAPMASAGNIRFVSNARVQPTPGDQGPPTGEVPICEPNEQDNCINSWEARKTGTRPLNYWPGESASN
ncbi:hypothetical protein [Qipengyuania sp. MTN3-11]|uniref:hypothetical protein n=1 Tax=Qipengyuania sp. MTN3-11 TaxID=3056557 RepID=UPI0036F19830